MSADFYLTKTLKGADFDAVIERVEAALADQGFGVLSDIDVAATFKKKLDLDYPPYRILGACNPGYAKQALEINDKIGALLPCNVIVQKKGESIEVSAVDPQSMLSPVDDASLKPLADAVREKLQAALDNL